MINILASRAPTQCPACRDTLASAPVGRSDCCDTPHHAECLEELGCASLACSEEHESRALQANPLHQAAEEGYYSHRWDAAHLIWHIAHATECQFQTDTVGRSNERVLDREFGACSFYSSGEFRVLREPCDCESASEPWDCERRAVETLDALESYPVLDDDDHSEVMQDEEESQWDHWGRDDFAREIGRLIPDSPDYDGTSEALDDLRWEAQEGTHEYPEGCDDVAFPLVDWARWVVENRSRAELDDLGWYLPEHGPKHLYLGESNRRGFEDTGREAGEAGDTPRQAYRRLREQVAGGWSRDPTRLRRFTRERCIRHWAREAFVRAYLAALASVADGPRESGDVSTRGQDARAILERIRRGDWRF